MPERSALSQVTQIGVEGTSTPGTVVAANRRLAAVSIPIGPETADRGFRPAGQKFESLHYTTKEWASAPLEGEPAYNELPYLLSGVMSASAPAASQIMDGATPTGGYTWTFQPAITAADAPRTFTIERGSTVRAHRAAYGLIRSLGLSIDREGCELDGEVMAQRITDGITLTAAPTANAAVPIRPQEVDVFMDATSAALGTTKLTRCLSLDWHLNDRFGGVWPLDTSQQSFAAHVETEPDHSGSITVESDSQGMGLLDRMRDGAMRYFRLRCLGPTIYTGGVTVQHSLTLDFAATVTGTGGFDEDEGLDVIEWSLAGVADPVWGASGTSVKATVITTLAAL